MNCWLLTTGEFRLAFDAAFGGSKLQRLAEDLHCNPTQGSVVHGSEPLRVVQWGTDAGPRRRIAYLYAPGVLVLLRVLGDEQLRRRPLGEVRFASRKVARFDLKGAMAFAAQVVMIVEALSKLLQYLHH